MKCPYCGKEAKIAEVAIYNMESYMRPVRALSECCGKILHVSPRAIFSAHETRQDTPDDWGHTGSKP